MGKSPSERELIPGIRTFMNSGDRDQLVLDEIPTLWGRPDVILVNTNGQIYRNLMPLSRSDLVVASLISRSGPLSRASIAERSGLTEESLSQIIDRLLSRGIVMDRGGMITTSVTPPLFGEITAIEVKTRDWISGLRQAKRYRTFADEVFLFLGREIRGMDYSTFRRDGIGLGVVETGHRIAIPPADTSGENVGFARRLVEENILRALSRRRHS